MWEHNDKPVPVMSAILPILAIPCNFFAGLVTGLVAPVAAIAAMVAGIRLATGKVPFLGHVWVDEEGERRLSLKLVSPDRVGDLIAEQKEQIGGDLAKMKAEIEAIIEEAKAQTDQQEESGEAKEEGNVKEKP